MDGSATDSSYDGGGSSGMSVFGSNTGRSLAAAVDPPERWGRLLFWKLIYLSIALNIQAKTKNLLLQLDQMTNISSLEEPSLPLLYFPAIEIFFFFFLLEFNLFFFLFFFASLVCPCFAAGCFSKKIHIVSLLSQHVFVRYRSDMFLIATLLFW